MFIYSITNQLNDKKFIGVSILPLPDRKWYQSNEINEIISLLQTEAQRKLHTLESFSKLAQAFIEDGEDSFKWEVIESHTNAEALCKRQKYFITLHDSFQNGYNMQEGLKDISVFHNAEKELNLDGYFNTENHSGEKHVNSKLTYENVKEIKLLLADGWSLKRIAKKFNISSSVISMINRGIAWKDSNSKEQAEPIKKGRASSLSPDELKRINELLLSGKYTMPELEEQLSISRKTIKKYQKKLQEAGHEIIIPLAKREVKKALTDEQAREIKLYIQSGLTQKQIAEQYKVSKALIAKIHQGRAYSHIVI